MKAMKVLGTLLLVGMAACVTSPADDSDEATKAASSVGDKVDENDDAPSCFCNGCTKYCEVNGVKSQGTCC